MEILCISQKFKYSTALFFRITYIFIYEKTACDSFPNFIAVFMLNLFIEN